MRKAGPMACIRLGTWRRSGVFFCFLFFFFQGALHDACDNATRQLNALVG